MELIMYKIYRGDLLWEIMRRGYGALKEAPKHFFCSFLALQSLGSILSSHESQNGILFCAPKYTARY